MKNLVTLLIFVSMVTTLFPLLVAAQPDPQGTFEALERTSYRLEVAVDLPAGQVTAHETITLTNVWDEELRELVFNVTSARTGALQIGNATVGDQTVPAVLKGVVLSLPLTEPLAPGGSTVATIDFSERVPSPGDLRFGRGNGVGVLALGNWYPVLSTYRSGQGWDRHLYVDTGDAFVTAVADYEVRLSLTGASTNATVVHAGSLVSHVGNSWTMRAQNVRDFALAISERYATSSTEVDGTRIAVFYLPEHAAGGAIYLRAATESFRWYNRTLGSYPYSQLNIVETTGNDPGWVAQEYPTVIFIGSSSTAAPGEIGDYLTYAIAHEVAHQWFYGLVGDDQVYEPWLDEAFATYLGYHYLRLTYPAAFAARWPLQRGRYESSAAAIGRHPVNSSIYDFDSEADYYAMVYSQGALFLDDLRHTLGDDNFWQLLRDFVARFRYQIASGHSFLQMAEQRHGKDLHPLYARYFTRGLFSSALDYDVPAGHYYTQANGQPIGTSMLGYSVTNADGIPLWDEFRRLGGVDGVGYPASRRFVWDGFVSQVFQKGVFQWRPEAGTVYLVNVFDQMNRQGKDDWLRAFRSIPAIAGWSTDHGRNWTDVVQTHQRLMDDNAAIRQRYFSVSDPVAMYGLPMAPIADTGSALVLRAQRVIIQQWKTDMPWARAGDVTIANGGDIAKEAGLIPANALRVESTDQ